MGVVTKPGTWQLGVTGGSGACPLSLALSARYMGGIGVSVALGAALSPGILDRVL